MRTLTLELDEGLIDRSQEYARRQGTTLEDLVSELLAEKVREPGAAVRAMFEEADRMGLRTEGGFLKREEIFERG